MNYLSLHMEVGAILSCLRSLDGCEAQRVVKQGRFLDPLPCQYPQWKKGTFHSSLKGVLGNLGCDLDSVMSGFWFASELFTGSCVPLGKLYISLCLCDLIWKVGMVIVPVCGEEFQERQGGGSRGQSSGQPLEVISCRKRAPATQEDISTGR